MKLSKQALIALGITGVGMLSAEDLTREQLNRMLEATATNPVTSALSPGACCYDMAAPPERIEYLCPLCKTKTLHAKWQNVGLVQNASQYRQQLKRIKELGLNATLDETDLCSQCRRDKTTDKVNFYILVTVGDRMVRTQLEGADLDKIIAFLEKKDVWADDMGATRPLKAMLPRIRKILGTDGNEKTSQAN